jgi:hypothetical protein
MGVTNKQVEIMQVIVNGNCATPEGNLAPVHLDELTGCASVRRWGFGWRQSSWTALDTLARLAP